MTSNAISSQGLKLEIANGTSPITYTEVKELTKFNAFNGKATEIDITNLQSTSKEVLMGLQDFGSFTCDVNHIPTDTGQQALRTAKAAKTKLSLRVTFSDMSTASFSAYVLSNPLTGGIDAKVDGSFELRITGDVTFS
jgi:hypothetical protein